MRTLELIFLILVLAVLLLGCAEVQTTTDDEENGNGNLTLNCTVRYVELEGGFYGLICGDEKYYPVNLPEEYRQDGLRVCVVARIANVTTFTMWGTPVEVLAIYKI